MLGRLESWSRRKRVWANGFLWGGMFRNENNEVERVEMVEREYVDWAKGEGLNTYRHLIKVDSR